MEPHVRRLKFSVKPSDGSNESCLTTEKPKEALSDAPVTTEAKLEQDANYTLFV